MLITRFFKTLLGGVGWLLLGGFCFLLWGFMGQGFLGQSAILAKSQQLLKHEKRMIGEEFNQLRWVESLQNRFSDQPFNEWQILSASNDLAPLKGFTSSLQKMPRLKGWIKINVLRFQISQQIFLTLLHCLALRLIVMWLFLPLIGLLSFVGFVDGLTQRHLRKLQGARESSVLYQRSREGLTLSFLSGAVLYLGLPIAINPMIWFLTFAALFSLLLSIAARTYKKYL